jgi:DNA-binding HxlR family transcriptional regulator
MASRSYGQYCGVASALDLVGERWALLIVRDLLVGPRRYTDLKAGLPRIPTNILSSRLKELQEGGVVRRIPLAHGLAYELTDYGHELEDVVLALGRWGFSSMGQPGPDDIVTPDSITMALRTAFRADAAARHPETTYVMHVGDFALRVRVGREGLEVAPLDDGVQCDLEFAAGPAIRQLISGELSADEAIEEGVAHVLAGDATVLGRFADTFHLDPFVAAA